MKQSGNRLKVVELFAGVGGFRLGLEKIKPNGSPGFEVVWSSQWEPSTQKQHASKVYEERFGLKGHSNEDIAKVPTEKIFDHDLLVGGFPCQDYSVARTLSKAAGLQGRKGVLWWSIERILREKGARAPRFLMLENVDRLLKSPSRQRGRDFAVMLASLASLDYILEWRVINAAEYGMPQRRRRIYMLGYKKGTLPHKEASSTEPLEWLTKKGLFAKAFPVIQKENLKSEIELNGNLQEISEKFNLESPDQSPFFNSGIMINGKIWTTKTAPQYEGETVTLGQVLQPIEDVAEHYFIDEKQLKEWEYLKGGKKEPRKTKDGFTYQYSEGPMAFPDPLNKASRTIVTGEGGSTPSRFKHIIKQEGRYRRLTPIELERLNMFPDNHTALGGISDVKRAFFMGNALVVGVITRLGRELAKRSVSKPPSTKPSSDRDSLSSHRAPKLDKRASLTV